MHNNKLVKLKDIKSDTEKEKETGSLRSERKEPWESGIKILESVDVVAPVRLLHVCDAISKKVFGDEFSILVNIKEKEENTIFLGEEFYIPKQRVSHTSIDYLPDNYSFNTVIHRHPDGMNTFSPTDRSFINQNFELSILYTREDGFVNGVFNLMHESYLIQIPVVIYIDYGMEDIDITNIERESLLSLRSRIKDDRFGKWDMDKTKSDDRDLFSDIARQEPMPVDKLDYALMKDMLLDDVNAEIQDLDYRVSSIEDTMLGGGPDERIF
ncbi:MAG: hypothetical protein LWX70_14935 [Sphingobacteriia bacterium]|nr:hypothetical protein [Sphingobacteriia bacterium]